MTIEEMQQEAWQNSEDHGFHDLLTNRNFGMRLALIHSELSEALEEYRDCKEGASDCILRYDKNGKPEGVGPELADVIIRLGDFAQEYGIDLQKMVRIKMDYNKTRPYLHGGKRA